MKADKEYAVSLLRLNCPSQNLAQKMILSLKTFDKEIFIAQQKVVKNEKIHFYRQTLFVSTLDSGLTFRIYSIGKAKERRLLKSFPIESDSLASIHKRAAMFHTTRDGYQLVWECSVFSACSELENEETDKEYSEFKLPNDSCFPMLPINSKKQSQTTSIRLDPIKLKNRRRSTSVGSSRVSSLSVGKKLIKKTREAGDSPIKNVFLKKNRQVTKNGMQQLFSYFRDGVSGLFSHSEAVRV